MNCIDHKSLLAERSLALIGALYEFEQEVSTLSHQERRQLRQDKAKPRGRHALPAWMSGQRQKAPDGSAIAMHWTTACNAGLH